MESGRSREQRPSNWRLRELEAKGLDAKDLDAKGIEAARVGGHDVEAEKEDSQEKYSLCNWKAARLVGLKSGG